MKWHLKLFCLSQNLSYLPLRVRVKPVAINKKIRSAQYLDVINNVNNVNSVNNGKHPSSKSQLTTISRSLRSQSQVTINQDMPGTY